MTIGHDGNEPRSLILDGVFSTRLWLREKNFGFREGLFARKAKLRPHDCGIHARVIDEFAESETRQISGASIWAAHDVEKHLTGLGHRRYGGLVALSDPTRALRNQTS